jgi:hypothetical protein
VAVSHWSDEIAAHRPITLLNCDYKLVARALVQRFTPAAEAVVDPGQTAFLPGRWIGDNILQHLEVVEYCNAEQLPGCIMFLDFEKAYDRRGWIVAGSCDACSTWASRPRRNGGCS